MKILLINPNPSLFSKNNRNNSLFNRIKGRFYIISAPISLPMIAAVTPKHHIITLVDENYQNIDYNDEFDIVGITTMTLGAPRAYEIADEFRKKNITVVIGGVHASVLPNEAKQHADSVVVGEAEETWPQLLKDFENGKLKPFYYQTKPVALDNIPPPRRDIINRSFIAAGVQTSRGCPFKCKYCFYSNSIYGKDYRKRPIYRIVEEIKNIPQKLIIFHDSSFTIDIDHTKNLFKDLKGLGKKFICLGNVDILSKDDDLLELAAEAGCVQWHIGFESLSAQALEQVGKKTNKVENYLKAVKKIHDHGMNVHGFFMFGFDKESISVYEETLQFLKKAKLDSADFSILVPYPGTVLYDELIEENRIVTKDWSQYTFNNNIVFKPLNKSQKEILKNMKKLLNEFYSYQFIAQRFLSLFKRRSFNYHFILFIIENVFTRKFYLKINKNQNFGRKL